MRFPDTPPPFAQGMNAYRDTASSRGGAVSLHHHVPVGVERQLIGRIIARAVGKLGIDGRQVNDRTGYGDFVVAELAVTARTHHIVTRSGIRAGTGGLRIVGEPGRAVEKRVGIRTCLLYTSDAADD